jgi:YidC/Oxa1 family membrane protein insertase
MMPLMSVYIAFIVPGAIGVYWMFKNVVTVIKQVIVAKLMPIPVVSEEEMRAAEEEVNLSNRQRKKQEKARSLHHIDDETYADVVNRMEDRYEDKPAEEKADKADGLIAPAPLKDDDRKNDKKKN